MSIHFYLVYKKVHNFPLSTMEEEFYKWFEKNRFRSHILYLIASHYGNSQFT